jgi:hypothetical protein
MSVPPIPPPFEHLGHRPFSFFPAIVGIEHNEWRYKKSTWSEVLVANTKTGEEIWMPRRFLAELARIEEPVMIWGLAKELEYKAGVIVPHVRRVIEMPRAVNDVPRPQTGAAAAPEPRPAPVVGIRLESGAEARIGRLIGAMLVFGITATAIYVGVYRYVWSGRAVTYKAIVQSSLGLTAQDDYYSVVRKFGQPVSDRWRDDAGEVQYRRLEYSDKNLILMGRERGRALYIGALDRNWRVMDSVELAGGVKTYAMLATLPEF